MPKIGQTGTVTRAQKDEQIQLYCAGSWSILPTIKDKSIDFIMTDPPYGHNNNDGDLIHAIEMAIPNRRKKGDDGTQVYDARPIANDGREEADGLVQWLFTQSGRVLVPGGCCCCCGGGGGPDPQFARWSLWMDDSIEFKQMVIWDKGPIGMGWHYRRSYETVLVGQQPGAACKWYADKSNVENILRPGGRCKKIIPSSDDHPTPKPVALADHFLRLHTRQGDLVLDCFMGAGWVGMACKRLNRRFIGIEIDPHWFQEAKRNIEQTQPLEYGIDTVREPTYEALFDEDTGTKWTGTDPFA